MLHFSHCNLEPKLLPKALLFPNILVNLFSSLCFNSHFPDVQPVWTSTPSRALSVVESENITLLWQYNLNGTQLSYTKFFKMIGDGQSKKLIALKPSSSSAVTVDSAFQDRFFFNISENRASVKILPLQRSDRGTYRYEVSNQDLFTISNDVKMTVLCE